MNRFLAILLISFSFVTSTYSAKILIPMDEAQQNHLKAYGLAYWVLAKGGTVDWLLNYRGGSFACDLIASYQSELRIRGISFEVITDPAYVTIQNYIASPEVNMDLLKLEKAPTIAVYSPKTKLPWDDAVTMVLTYAEIPYTVVFDEEVLNGELAKYDWLHLHHEDFTGQYGKFYAQYHHEAWYQKQQAEYEALAARFGYEKVSQMKLGVVTKIREFCAGGGFLFAMCSATDTYDIALAAAGTDICEHMYDGDPMDPAAQQKLNYTNCFAFEDFKLVKNPLQYEYSDIDNNPTDRPGMREGTDYFTLFEFSAKWDPVPTMLTQNHERVIEAFMGQTTGFKEQLIKSDVLVMGENKALQEARYIHGTYGQGTWTFYGGHDPEDYQHFVHEEPTDLNLFPNSPGYRLILNNVLFPAAKKKKQKT
jgi:hypothetical protein